MGIFGQNRDSNSQPGDNMTGLLRVFGCYNSNRKADIVFVHGLAGHPWSTWHPQNNRDGKNIDFWLYWLGEDLQKEGIDAGIWTFGYEAARFQFTGNAMPLFDQASNLLNNLENNDVGKRPLIFVTHSMGGLLVKELIRRVNTYRKQEFIQNTKGIVFLSTPHQGAELATLISHFMPSVNVQELKAHNPTLRELNEWYQNNANDLKIETKVFYESEPTAGILVVNPSSANPSIFGVMPVAVPSKDHNTIAKPKKNDLVYESVKLFVKKELSTDSTIEIPMIEKQLPQSSRQKRLIQDIVDLKEERETCYQQYRGTIDDAQKGILKIKLDNLDNKIDDLERQLNDM